MLQNISPNTLAELWEKQPDESAKAFSAFKTYRDIPPSLRSMKKAVQIIYGEVTQGKLGQFQKWSTKFSWVLRATAWDEEKDKQERLQQVAQIAEAKNRHLAISKSLQSIAISKLKKINESDISSVDQLLRVIESAYKMEREILGMNSIEITETEIEQQETNLISDLSGLSTTELRKRIALRRLHIGNSTDTGD